jgi:Tfp pilus assembly protein PilN
MVRLNLLPPERKQFLASRARNRLVMGAGGLLIGILLSVVLILVGLNLLEGATVTGNKRRIEEVKKDLTHFAEIEKTVLTIRERVATLESLEKSRLSWSKIAEDLMAVTPVGVQLVQLSANSSSSPHLTLTGQAESKEKVASLRERLEANAGFEQALVRQIGQTQTAKGLMLTTFTIEANLTGVTPPKPAEKPKESGK